MADCEGGLGKKVFGGWQRLIIYAPHPDIGKITKVHVLLGMDIFFIVGLVGFKFITTFYENVGRCEQARASSYFLLKY